jgi:hypothetical protein
MFIKQRRYTEKYLKSELTHFLMDISSNMFQIRITKIAKSRQKCRAKPKICSDIPEDNYYIRETSGRAGGAG